MVDQVGTAVGAVTGTEPDGTAAAGMVVARGTVVVVAERGMVEAVEAVHGMVVVAVVDRGAVAEVVGMVAGVEVDGTAAEEVVEVAGMAEAAHRTLEEEAVAAGMAAEVEPRTAIGFIIETKRKFYPGI